MLGGAVLAVFSINLKRTLACSSMSQIGFILTGIAMGCLLGEENALAARGALLYMVNHSLFKLGAVHGGRRGIYEPAQAEPERRADSAAKSRFCISRS